MDDRSKCGHMTQSGPIGKKIRLLLGLLENKISLSLLGLESEKGYDLELGQPFNDYKKSMWLKLKPIWRRADSRDRVKEKPGLVLVTHRVPALSHPQCQHTAEFFSHMSQSQSHELKSVWVGSSIMCNPKSSN